MSDYTGPEIQVNQSLIAPQLLPRARRKPKERYRLLKLLGRGGSGAVYKAEDLELDRIIAIKLLHPALASDERYLEVLKREVVIASEITHPNVVRVFDLSELSRSPIITMAYIQGESLASILHRNGALSSPRIWHYLRQLCSGLEAAHRRGVVHRDLKPQNLLVDHEGRLFISDFGLAHAAHEHNYRFESNDSVGTLRYMSPEQFHSLPVDARSDIFSLGLILYQMLTGAALEIDHGAKREIAVDRKTGRAVSLPHTLPPPLTAIALRCLALNPERRYQSVSEILACLPVDVPAAGVSSTAGGDQAPVTTSGASQLQNARAWRRVLNKGRGFFWIPASLLLVGAALWTYWNFHLSPSLSSEQLYREATADLGSNDPHSLEKAVALFQFAAALKPGENAFEGLARANLQLFQLDAGRHWLSAARSAVAKAEKFDQGSRSASLLHAEIDLAAKDPTSALSRLSHILASEKPSDDVLRLLAKAQVLAGRSTEALVTWQHAIALNPNFWLNYNGYGAVLMALGQPEKAKVEFRKVIQLNPSSHIGYANLGAAYVACGDFEKAVSVTEKSLTIHPAAAQYNNLGTALYYTGSYHAALQMLRQALELNPRSELYFGNLAEAYRAVGDKESAMVAYGNALPLAQEAHRERPNDTRVTARLGTILAKLGRIEEGQLLISSALAADPSNPEVLYSKAILCVIRNQYTEGASAAKAALADGYSIEAAARDPELKPLWADANLKKRFEIELSRSPGSRTEDERW
ncbi:MAG: protein kinase [Bryobacterales bacterium]|nr:protein kinase [Bryobacterales bacterium]